MRRYFTVVGIILVVLIGLGFWLKPSLQDLRESVDGEGHVLRAGENGGRRDRAGDQLRRVE